jgi:organic radical activating enzyme
MFDHPNYNVAIKELQEFIKYTTKHFMFVRLTGGEPKLWTNYDVGMKLLLEDFKGVMVNTFFKSNDGKNESISEHINKTQKGIKHTPLPDKKIISDGRNFCHCARHMYLDGNIYFCSNIYNLYKKFNLELEKYRCAINKNYLEKFENLKFGEIEHCNYCHSNQKVKDYFKNVKKKQKEI